MSLAAQQSWFTEAEAAEYARCSLWAFRRMGIPAKDSGGRKVYHRSSIDAALEARPQRRLAISAHIRSA